MRREEALTRTNEYFDTLRSSNSRALSAREKEIREKCASINELINRRAQLPLKSMRLAMNSGADTARIAEEMKTEGLKLNRDIRAELVKAGYPENYLSMHYTCTMCRDTGFLPGIPAIMCDCYKKKLSEFMRTGDGVSDFSKLNFQAFDPDRIPAEEIAPGLSQRDFTVRIKDACEDYAESFPHTYKNNIVLSGPAGVGKTFLINCIAGRVEERGFNVTIITAYMLLEAMRAKHLKSDNDLCEFDRLLTVPLLLIDDLGSEPILRNISREYLGLLINERMLRGLHTVISCNLTRTQICETYDERIMSRLCDKDSWDFITMKGKDIRRYDPSRV